MKTPVWIRGQIGDSIIAVLSAGLVVVALVFAYVYYTTNPTPEKSDSVAYFVTDFGKQIESVPLNDGTPEEINTAMDSLYSPYVSHELIEAWKANPSEAPGRYSINPRPVGIRVSSVQNVGIGTYVVKAYIIEEVRETGEDREGKRIVLGITGDGTSLKITEYQELPRI